jgi:hypothetical protein
VGGARQRSDDVVRRGTAPDAELGHWWPRARLDPVP